ncbi:DUF4982 domain-containing protein [Sphingobacterium sp. SGG-5]|uniref:sugar-binding domain-containing protein n=1 Tax=Sphingobacterium sp. SGG-5 TaxID=2710881 RepID=UPI0013EBD2B1|nr:sugar-binding domain-containing protein [Sphingobacterium sp. SGG-5]NGM63105.1 DUF4982 domain-containing protein [Sphingobacterium sp. SGG-5]
MILKHWHLLACLFISSLLGLPKWTEAQVGFGQSELLNENWLFILEDTKDAKNAAIDETKWQSINLPHDWSVKGKLDPTLASCTGYLPGGIGWYRKTLKISGDRRGEKIYIYFEGVYNRSDVYINGQLLGHRPNGYISFMYDITPYIKYDQNNMIAVRVDHSRHADSRWYTGSGIYRNVWLIHSPPIHIAQWGVSAYPKKDNSSLKIEVSLQNHTPHGETLLITNELFAPNGQSVAKKSQSLTVEKQQDNKLITSLQPENPLLWDVDHPNLYQLVTIVSLNGKILDSTNTATGFRTFNFDPNKGFALNGKPMKIKGVCLHHDAGVLGAAVPKQVWRKRLLTLKEIGCNAIRTSHNPQSPDLYALCDELGLLVLNEAFDEWEFPKRKWIEGWNVGIPGLDGSYDFFESWGEQDLADMVKRDRNHISIFAWSIGNEVDYPNDPYSHPILDGDGGFTQKSFGGYKKEAPDANRLGTIAEKLVKVVKQHDTSRPVTAGLAGVAMSNETTYPGALDIAGYNYTENRYISDHKKYPNRVIYGSENRHDLKAWKAVMENDHIFGQFLWTGIDYLGESGKWPSRGFYSGLMDFAGLIKPRGYFRQSLWSDKPMAYLGTYSIAKEIISEDVLSQTEQHKRKARIRLSMDAWPQWKYEPGELIRVVCYTNTAHAQLILNGKKWGLPKPYDSKTGITYWDVPYEAGTLEVIGMDANDRQVAHYSIVTPQKPYAIKVVECDDLIRKKDGVAQVRLQIVDDKGNLVTDASHEIRCNINGEAELLGLEGGNNSDMGNYTDNKHNAHRGNLTAYIKIKAGNDKPVSVDFSAKGLKSGYVNFNKKR